MLDDFGKYNEEALPYYEKYESYNKFITDVAEKNRKKNEFLTKLFEEYYKELKQETEDLKKYQEAIESVDFKDVNKAYDKIKTMTHYLSSKEELWSRLKAQASKQGLVYDKASDKFLSSNAKSNK